MRSRGELHLIVFLVVYNLSVAHDVKVFSGTDPDNINLCYWMSSTTNGRTHYSFLRESAGIHPKSLRLYFSTWAPNQRLVNCVVSEETAVIESYLSLCREGRAEIFLGQSVESFNTSLLLAPGNPCVIHSAAGFQTSEILKQDLQVETLARNSVEVSSKAKLHRLKRSWIFPGTLWCGLGTKANDYEDVGMFMKTDRCCREHDHCKNTIPAFRVNYGAFNHNLFTVSHCDCDHRFRQCLLEVNDPISHMVGYSFFNVLKVPCFEFIQRKHCTQLSWWGLCKVVQVAPYAVFKDPAVYNSTDISLVGKGSVPAATAGKQSVNTVTSSSTSTTIKSSITPAITSCQTQGHRPKTAKRPKGKGRCSPRGPPRGDTFQPSRRRGSGFGWRKGGKASVELMTTPLMPTTSTSPTTALRNTTTLSAGKKRGSLSLIKQRKQLLSENALPTVLPRAPKMHASNNLPAPVQDTRYKEKLQFCDCYKQLDECKYKILPQEERYGLRNLESKTLYHCNCTRRLARQLRQLKEPNAVQSLLVDFVSVSCFKVPSIEDCPGRRRCAALVSKATHLKKALKKMELTEGARDPVASAAKVKRQNTVKPISTSPPVRLYKRCLRIIGPKSPRKHKLGILGKVLN